MSKLARVVELVELGGPHLVLADLGGDDRVAVGQLVERFDDILRLDDLAVLHVGQRMLASPFLDLLKPGLVLFGHLLRIEVAGLVEPGVHGLEGHACSRRQWECRP